MHSAWRLALVCAGFVAGVATALAVQLSVVPSLVAGFGLVVPCFIIGRVFLLPVLALGAVCCGLGYGSYHLSGRAQYDGYVGQTVRVQGTVREDPSLSKSGAYSVQLGGVQLDGHALSGTVFTSVKKIGGVKRGDKVVVVGMLRAGFGSFAASMSAERFASAVRPVPGDVGRVVRDWFADEVRTVIAEPQASLGIGFLTGQKSALPTELADALKVAGLTHIVVASGYNLTILVQMARRLFARTSKYLAAVSSGLMITTFMAVTGLSPSMTRAGLVSGMSLVAWYYGHTFHPFILLPFAAAVTVCLQPSYVWGDLGWQLSFAAFAGVMIVAPLLQAYFFGDAPPGVLRQILGETVAAHAVTVPVIALSFGVVSNVAIIANLLVVPLVPLAMLLTFLSGVVAVIGVPFAWIIAVPTEWLLTYMTTVAETVAGLEWAQSEVEVAPVVWVAYVVLLVGACAWMWRKTRLRWTGREPS